MARAQTLINPVAAAFGHGVAAYSRAVISLANTDVTLDAPLPRTPTVWMGWHEGNLVTLALHGAVTGRSALAFVPPGVNGASMRGWLEGLGITPVALAADARRGLGLRQMETALAGGKDVLIAVDGPRGPRYRIAPGAMWLARAIGVEARPVGIWAHPSVRLPRWDRLVVPLPGARMGLVIGRALREVGSRAEARAATAEIAATLHALTARAKDAVLDEGRQGLREMLPWR